MSEKEHNADSALEAHEEQIRKFEDAWQLGARPRIEDYLPNDERARCAVLFELVLIDLENRTKRGDSFQVEEYFAEFSELASSPEAAELVAAEYELRRGHGSDATQEEYLNRFPELAERLRARWTDAKHRGDGRFPLRLNCPHCRNPIEIVEAEDADVICPSCGSSFMLDADRTQSWSPEKLPTLGKFRLEKAVGRGAFGTVYRARDTELDRVVAVKIPRSGKLATQEDEDRFIREARSVAQLQHPSIVAVHEVGRSDTFPYIVADFVEGITLADALTGKQYSFREAAKLIAKVAEAVDHAHQNGVIHRDLKPSNIMLTSASQTADDSFDSGVRVMDFGLARRDEGEITMTLEGQVLGTPAYMSPEQARGEGHRVDARTDVYSLGVILYELLTGELPFRGNSRMLLHQVLNDDPKSLRRLNDLIPRDLETICLKCMEKDRARRYPTAGEVAADCRRYLNGHPITARPVSRTERGWRWCKRNPVFASFGAILLTLSAGLSLCTSWLVATTLELQVQRDLAKQSADRAHEQKAIVEEYLRESREAVEAFLEEGGVPIVPAQAELLQLELEVHERVVQTEGVDPLRRTNVARALFQIGSIKSVLGSPGALEAYQEAIEVQQSLVNENPKDDEQQETLAIMYTRLGELQVKEYDPVDGYTSLGTAAEIFKAISRPGDVPYVSFAPTTVGLSREAELKGKLVGILGGLVTWPNNKMPSSAKPLTIGIVGDDPFVDDRGVNHLEQKLAGTGAVVLKFPDASAYEECHILVVSKAADFEKALAKTRGNSILVVSESPGLAKKGAAINLVFDRTSNEIRLEINEIAATSAGLQINPGLVRSPLVYIVQ